MGPARPSSLVASLCFPFVQGVEEAFTLSFVRQCREEGD